VLGPVVTNPGRPVNVVEPVVLAVRSTVLEPTDASANNYGSTYNGVIASDDDTRLAALVAFSGFGSALLCPGSAVLMVLPWARRQGYAMSLK